MFCKRNLDGSIKSRTHSVFGFSTVSSEIHSIFWALPNVTVDVYLILFNYPCYWPTIKKVRFLWLASLYSCHTMVCFSEIQIYLPLSSFNFALRAVLLLYTPEFVGNILLCIFFSRQFLPNERNNVFFYQNFSLHRSFLACLITEGELQTDHRNLEYL